MPKKNSAKPAAPFLLSACLFLCSACSSPRIAPNYDTPKSADGKLLGSIHFNESDTEDTNKLNLYKINKGYALKANLDDDKEQNRKGDLVLSRDKEYRWFAGLQWRFSF